VTDPQVPLGFAHFLAQTDTVGRALLVLLIAMSAISWTLILLKGLSQALRARRSEQFLRLFWNARSLDEVNAEISTHGARDPFANLTAHAMLAKDHHTRYGAARLSEAGSADEFVTRTIRKVLDEENTRLENGLTTLATIGATAPFVGLFGTVWGVYHALVAIGMSGSGTLDKVAGPVGEALIMTAIGLAVAVPAVVAYNAFSRNNRVLNAKLDAFAFELLTFLSMGQSLHAGQRQSVAPSTPSDAVRALRPVAQA
jgi:biopolymer transport protein ExbB